MQTDMQMSCITSLYGHTVVFTTQDLWRDVIRRSTERAGQLTGLQTFLYERDEILVLVTVHSLEVFTAANQTVLHEPSSNLSTTLT